MPIIETNGLCKRYGHALSVHDLALRVPEGSVYGFLRPQRGGQIHHAQNDPGPGPAPRREESPCLASP